MKTNLKTDSGRNDPYGSFAGKIAHLNLNLNKYITMNFDIGTI